MDKIMKAMEKAGMPKGDLYELPTSPKTVLDFNEMKKGEKITYLTAYDFPNVFWVKSSPGYRIMDSSLSHCPWKRVELLPG